MYKNRMARTKNHRKKPEEEHTYLTIRVEQYEACVQTSVNHNVYAPQHAWDSDENNPLYPFSTRLTITGISTHPETRAGEAYELTVYGDDARSRRHNTTLKDAQTRDEHESPQYREYRGRQIPVYNPPNGLGLLEKVRGEPRWIAWLFVAPRFVNDALVLLGQGRNLFLAIHEHREKRARWIQAVSLQTADPEEE